MLSLSAVKTEAGSVLVTNKDPAISALLRGTVAISECGQDDVKRPNRQRKPRVSVLTGRINQDCLENLFSQVRCKGGHRFNPSAREFAFAYRSLTTSMLINPIPSANCIDDPDDLLVSLSDLSKTSTNDARVRKRRNEGGGQGEIPAKQARQSETDPLMVDVIDDFQLSVTVVNVVAYVAGYIIRKIQLQRKAERHEPCSSRIKTPDTLPGLSTQ